MKTKEMTNQKLKEKQQTNLLSIVAAKLKGRILFPEKLERDRELIKNIKLWPLK